MKKHSLSELREMRAAALQRTEKASEQADELRFQSESLSATASKLVEQSFTAQSLARKYESDGDMEESAKQRSLHAKILSRARENYDKADQKGHLATEYQRKAFNQERLARELRERIKDLVSKPRGSHVLIQPLGENGTG